MTFDTLRQLHGLIGQSLETLEDLFSASQLEFPSLDGHFEAEDASEKLRLSDRAVEASNIIVAAAEQLIALVKLPYISLCDGVMAYHLPACLAFAEDANLVEILREAGPAGLHVNAIAAKIGIPSVKLDQIMRLLATHFYFREIKPSVFVNNRLSSLFDTGKSLSEVLTSPSAKYEGSSGAAAFVALAGDEMFKAAAYQCETNRSSRASQPDKPAVTAFSKSHSTSQGYFEWLHNPENRHRFERFGHGITGISLFEHPEALQDAYDWNSLPNDSLVVDVGGGLGIATLALSKSNPHLRFMIQDLPTVISNAESFWMAKHPDAWTSGRVTAKAHDFFQDQPVKDAKVFIVRAVCHDFPDKQASEILTRLRNAAQSNTILLLGDHIMPHTCEDTSSASFLPGARSRLAPLPLLANFGRGAATSTYFDMTMQTMFDSHERSLQTLVELCRHAGWSAQQVSLNGVSRFGYITACTTPGS